jgi:hypothetical protein
MMRRREIVCLFLALCVACRSGTHEPPADSSAETDGAILPSDKDATRDAPCFDDAAPGIRICCGQPGEVVGSNCADWDQIQRNLGRCIGEGAVFDAKEVAYGLNCCSGLDRLDLVDSTDGASRYPGLPSGCDFSGPVSLKLCARCGDGTCGDGENRCNCPKDCP